MLNRTAIESILLFRMPREDRESNFFSKLPGELIYAIERYSRAPQHAVVTLLHHIAYGNKKEVQLMLETTPSLVLAAGDVVTPSGYLVLRVTPYECALGGGDPDMAELIGKYFLKTPEAQDEKARQYARYRPAIDKLLNQTPYALNWLIEMITTSAAADIAAELEHDMTHASNFTML